MKRDQNATEEVSDRILTIPNVLTLIRFLLIPLYLSLLFSTPHYSLALAVFVIAACTDFVDGLAARGLNQVSRLGKVFDPLVDRFLLASGVIAICLLGRLPVWVVALLVTRDLILLVEGGIQMRLIGEVTKVSYIGKFATTFLLVGFSLLFLGMPTVDGLGIIDCAWLPGLGQSPALLGIFFVYAGIVLSVTVFFVYQYRGLRDIRNHREA